MSETSMDKVRLESQSVSIIIPAYNAMEFFAETMESIFSQTHQDFEVVVVNDGSTDGTAEFLHKLSAREPRVRVIDQINQGAAVARNTAIEAAKNEWIVCIDSDDLMVPNRIERQLAFIADHPEIAVATSYVHLIDRCGNGIGQFESPLTDHEVVRASIESATPISFHQPAVIMRKSVVLEVGSYLPELWAGQDLELWNRIAMHGYGVLVQPEYLTKYRIHSRSASAVKHHLQVLVWYWIRQTLQRRLQGEDQSTWHEFLEERHQGPWLQRMNAWRDFRGSLFYKRAVSAYVDGRYFVLAGMLAGAMLFSPIRTAKNVQEKYFSYRGTRATGMQKTLQFDHESPKGSLENADGHSSSAL